MRFVRSVYFSPITIHFWREEVLLKSYLLCMSGLALAMDFAKAIIFGYSAGGTALRLLNDVNLLLVF
jgi:hypothetical protein